MPEDLQSGLVAAESDANANFPPTPVGSSVQPCPLQRHWVDIQLFDGGEPAAGERYRLTLPDGRVEEGTLDSRGRVRFEDVKGAGGCSIVFPDIDAGGGDDDAADDSPDAQRILYVPGKPPAPLPLDAASVYRLPDWDLVAIEVKEPPGGGAAGGSGAADEDAHDEEDWDVVEMRHEDD
jgi:hypothetical protein